MIDLMDTEDPQGFFVPIYERAFVKFRSEHEQTGAKKK